jgi:hypothetical protein
MCVATIALWIRSEQAPWQTQLGFARVGPHGGIEDQSDWEWRIASSDGRVDIAPECSFYEWNIPYWRLVVAWLIVPARRLVPWGLLKVRRSHVSKGICPVCGYDLRATPERCPECGVVPKEMA